MNNDIALEAIEVIRNGTVTARLDRNALRASAARYRKGEYDWLIFRGDVLALRHEEAMKEVWAAKERETTDSWPEGECVSSNAPDDEIVVAAGITTIAEDIPTEPIAP